MAVAFLGIPTVVRAQCQRELLTLTLSLGEEICGGKSLSQRSSLPLLNIQRPYLELPLLGVLKLLTRVAIPSDDWLAQSYG